MSKYSVHQQPVETLLSWIKAGEIAIPEIQRPFVWKAAEHKMSSLLRQKLDMFVLNRIFAV